MWPVAAVSVLVLSMLIASLFVTDDMRPKALACSWISKEPSKRIPRGWRTGLKNLRNWLHCDATSFAQKTGTVLKMERLDRYLEGLEAPGLFFKVDLQKGTEKLGFGITPKSDYLEVEKLSGSGALKTWNINYPAKAVLLKDRIITINGIEGNGTLMADELRVAANVSMRFFRVAKSDQTIIEQRRADKEIKKVIKIRSPPGLGEGLPEPPGSKVVVLHARNIEKFIELQPLCVVMFYAHWCGHCQESAPDYTRAAELLSHELLPMNTRIAKFNDGDEVNKVVRAGHETMYNFSSYPSLILFQNGKKQFHMADSGPHEIVAALRAKAMDTDVDDEVNRALLKVKPKLYEPDGVKSDVVYDLEPDNFDDVVLKEYDGNNAVWIIEFYSDKCPFCKSLKPEIIKASEELMKKFGRQVRMGAVNSRAFGDIAKRFGVTSYPWIISVYANRKIEDMAGLGGWESVYEWASSMHRQAWKSKPKWSEVPILVPAAAEDDDKKRGKKEMGMFSNSTGSWRELLGRRTWFLLHTLAAKYPESPTEADKEGVKHLVSGLGQHYPCPICRKHLQAKLVNPELGPLPTESRQNLAIWFCKLHNLVNVDLKKPEQPCNAFQLDLMYLKSCGECSAKTTSLEDEEEVNEWDVASYFAGKLPPPRA